MASKIMSAFRELSFDLSFSISFRPLLLIPYLELNFIFKLYKNFLGFVKQLFAISYNFFVFFFSVSYIESKQVLLISAF